MQSSPSPSTVPTTTSLSTDYWRCNNCGAGNPPHVQQCQICVDKRPQPPAPTVQQQLFERGVLPSSIHTVPYDEGTIRSRDSHGSHTSWNCSKCTFENEPNTSRCEMCGTDRSISTSTQHEQKSAPISSPSPPTPSSERLLNGQWSCTSCTFVNTQSDATYCEICRSPRTTPPSSTSPSSRSSAPRSVSTSTCPPTVVPPHHWACPMCTTHNSTDRTQCITCNYSSTINVNQRKKNSLHNVSDIDSLDDEKQLKAAAEHWNEIHSLLSIQGEKFVDDSFPPGERSLYGNQIVDKKYRFKWCRGHDITKQTSDKWSVIAAAIRPSDIQQGMLGDCWLLSALAVLAERPKLLEKIIITKQINEIGAYQIRLCINGKWQVILVDDFFPVKSDGQLAYSKANGNQLWVPLIEKAYSKAHGSFQAIVSGNVYQAFADLTGAPSESIDLHSDQVDPEFIWAQLVSFRHVNFLMGACCGSEKLVDESFYAAIGLMSDHAYAVVDIYDEVGYRLIKLRNPWGRTEWKGTFHADSKRWSTALRSKLKQPAKHAPTYDSGTFWITFEELRTYFRAIDVCKLREGYVFHREEDVFKGTGTMPFISEHMYEIIPHQSTECSFSLIQPTLRGGDTGPPYVYRDLGMFVVKTGSHTNGAIDYSRMARVSEKYPESQQIITCEAFLTEPGQRYLVLPVSMLTTHQQQPLPYVFSVYSAFPVTVRRLASHSPALTIAAQLSAATTSQHALNDEAILYTHSGNGGLWFVLCNRSEQQYLQIDLDCSDSEGLLSSRGSLRSYDLVPPRCRQVLMVLSSINKFKGYKYKRHATFVHVDAQMEQHQPPLKPNDLHQPYRI